MTALAQELTAEADHLAARLGYPVVTVPGAAGVLNPTARAVVTVFGARVNQRALVKQVSTVPVRPQLLVLDGVPVDADDLRRGGWEEQPISVRLTGSVDAVAGAASNRVRQVAEADLPVVRTVMDLAFGDDDAEEILPDGVTRVPGLQLLLAEDDDGAVVGVAGVRLRRNGALVFGVGVLPHARRAGHGAALIGACARWVQARGERELHCDAEPSALRFWQGLGFAERTRWRTFDPVA
ncbi:MAG: GNAT family N-acetyltransferase [Actinomycetota bacterium]|nr:GNAT family N-acetyltransferase [Actinomycetota bacterium]